MRVILQLAFVPCYTLPRFITGFVLLLCRRPGCVLCRDEAQKLWREQQALTDAGLKVACIVHEWIDREVRCEPPGRL